jgi:hypothetical protein
MVVWDGKEERDYDPDFGPQKRPASIGQVSAQVKLAESQLSDPYSRSLEAVEGGE